MRIRIDGHAGYWLMPLHRPNHSIGRKQILPILPDIDAAGRDTVKYAGCRGGNTEQAYVDVDNQLTMKVADQWFLFNPPQMKHADDGKDAPPIRWFCPD